MTEPTPAFEQQRIDAILAAIPPDADRILDVGCCRHGRASRAWGNLHAALHQARPSATIVGIDSDNAAVTEMQAPGYDIRHIDAMNMEWAKPFDVIIAGELIEHLVNVGRFIHQAALNLAGGGRLLVTTPNPDGYRYFLRAGSDNWTSDSHTCWIDPQQLDTLASHSGLELVATKWLCRDTPTSRILQRLGKERVAANTYLGVLEWE